MNSIKEMNEKSTSGRHEEQIRNALGEEQPSFLAQKRSKLPRLETLLFNDIKKSYAEHMLKQYISLCEKYGAQQTPKNLRYLTWLYKLEDIDMDKVIHHCQEMKRQIQEVFNNDGNVAFSYGCCEIEIISFDKLAEQKTEVDSVKYRVLQYMAKDNEINENGSKALVHCHILLLLVDDGVYKIRKLRRRIAGLKKVIPRDLEIKKTRENQPLNEKLRMLAQYHSKCGNPDLRYKMTFASHDLVHLEKKMSRKGGRGKKEDYDHYPTPDTRSLTYGEIRWLNLAYDRLMSLGENRRGYEILYEKKDSQILGNIHGSDRSNI